MIKAARSSVRTRATLSCEVLASLREGAATVSIPVLSAVGPTTMSHRDKNHPDKHAFG